MSKSLQITQMTDRNMLVITMR